MAVQLPNGTVLSIAASYGTVKTITAITNANPGVATSTAHGFANGDILEVTSGWSKINGRPVRVAAQATNTFNLEGIDTTSTSRFPVGGGAGSTVRSVLTWVSIPQILEATYQGGEGQFLTYAFLEDTDDRQIPTTKSAQSITLSIGDDQALPHFALMVAADEDRLPRIVRATLPGGAYIYYNAYITFSKTPSLTRNEIMANAATLSFVAEATRYAS